MANVEEYLKSIEAGALPLVMDEGRDATAFANELLLSGLRLLEGLDLTDFKERSGIDLLDIRRSEIEMFEIEGLLKKEGARLSLTERALLISDYVIRKLAL